MIIKSDKPESLLMMYADKTQRVETIKDRHGDVDRVHYLYEIRDSVYDLYMKKDINLKEIVYEVLDYDRLL